MGWDGFKHSIVRSYDIVTIEVIYLLNPSHTNLKCTSILILLVSKLYYGTTLRGRRCASEVPAVDKVVHEGGGEWCC